MKLTSKSNHPICLVAANRFRTLVQRRVLRVEVAHERRLYVTPEIDDLLDGGKPGKGFPDAFARAFADRFMAGHLLGVSLVGTSGPGVDVERLRDLDEVWVFCVRKPRPGWRIFGRFMAKDCFIGLQAFDRHELGRVADYAKRAYDTIGLWNDLFPGRPPHRGNAIGDYLGGVWRDVDDKR